MADLAEQVVSRYEDESRWEAHVGGVLAGFAAYQVVDDSTVSVTISVTRKDPSRPASCIVRARSRDGAETGRREVLIPPSESKTVQVTTTVASYKRPFVGDIYGCGMNVPDYLVGS